MKVAIVGAGISGLVCARTLLDRGHDVTVFEKSRGVGGRMATRRTADGLQFDHGAQYFTVRDEQFGQVVREWVRDGVAAPWDGKICAVSRDRIEWKDRSLTRYVGTPRMNSICRHLAEGLHIELQTRLSAPEFRDGRWSLANDEGTHCGSFDCFLTSAPAPQSTELLAAAPDLQREVARIPMSACWAVMLAFNSTPDLPFDAAFVHDSPLAWIARNDTKPERADGQQCWILHASPEWTTVRLDDAPDAILPELVDAFWQATGTDPVAADYATAHRWRFALAPEPLEQRCLFDAERKVGACGDWCGGPRVEGAFLSGAALADSMTSC